MTICLKPDFMAEAAAAVTAVRKIWNMEAGSCGRTLAKCPRYMETISVIPVL